MKRRRLLLFAPLAGMLGLGCMQTVCSCLGLDHVVVHGTVTTAAGTPVQGASMHATLYPRSCDDPDGVTSPELSGAQVLTDAAGRYEVEAISATGGNACLRVTAVRGAGAQADSVWADGFTAPLVPREDDPNRVQVDLQFP